MPDFFSPEEVDGLDPALVSRLDKARGFAGVPFIITEGLGAGGSHTPNSAHQRGLAVDIRCSSSRNRMKIVASALIAGFRRIGVYDRHVHLDVDDTLPQDVIWVGVSK